MNRETTCCFTGHRPEKLPWREDEGDPRCLVESVAITVIGANLVDKILTAVIVWLLLRQLPIRTTRHFPAMAAVR